MNNPIISIIVPVYNVAIYLRECVESLLKQDIPNYEIILVDDGSSDESGSICDDYSLEYDNIRVIHKTNGGLGSARNAGINAANGKYIIFIDSDDYLETNCLCKLVNIADRDRLEILLYGTRTFSDDGELPQRDYYRRTKGFNIIQRGRDAIADAQRNNEYITSVCLRMYNLEYFRSLNLKFNESIIHEDEDVSFLSYAQAERTKIIPDQLYNRRHRGGSILATRKYYKILEGQGYAIRQVSHFFDNCQWLIEEKKICMKYCEIRMLVLLKLYSELDKEERKANKKTLKALLHEEKRHRQYYSPLIMLGEKIPDVFIIFNKARNRAINLKPLVALVVKEPESLITALAIRGTGNKIYLIGTPHHGNLGDHLITESELQFFRSRIPERKVVECSMRFARVFLSKIKKKIKNEDMIAISGGGWLGSEWKVHEDFVRKIIITFPQNRIIIMPQTAYYKNIDKYVENGEKIYRTHHDLYFCAREENTYTFISEYGFCIDKSHLLLLPDMALLSNRYQYYEHSNHSRSGIGVCFRDDIETLVDSNMLDRIKKIISLLDQNYKIIETNIQSKGIGKNQRSEVLRNKMNEIAGFKVIVTDRLHAMIMAALTGTPCIAFDNSTHKVHGVYNWIKSLEYIHFLSNIDNLEKDIREFLKNNTHYQYKLARDDEYKDRLISIFVNEVK